jgi:hypothetical protein
MQGEGPRARGRGLKGILKGIIEALKALLTGEPLGG